jgi:GTP-binding protein
VALLIDSRRGVLDSDQQVMALLDRAAVSYALVLTKADELKAAAQAPALEAAAAQAAKHTAALVQVHLTSALTGTGIPELRAHLAALSE